MKTLPETIEITFTEEDRQKAEEFCSNGSCLIATALQRMGYAKVHESVDETYLEWPSDFFLDGTRYEHKGFGTAESYFIKGSISKPHYGSEVVGTTLLLTKRP